MPIFGTDLEKFYRSRISFIWVYFSHGWFLCAHKCEKNKMKIKMLHISLLYTIEEKRGKMAAGRGEGNVVVWLARSPATHVSSRSWRRRVGRQRQWFWRLKKDHFWDKFFFGLFTKISFSNKPKCEKSSFSLPLRYLSLSIPFLFPGWLRRWRPSRCSIITQLDMT